MVKVSKHIDQLITRFLTGEASLSERQQLDSWLIKSDANQKYFDQIKFIHERASKTYPYINFDADKAWGRVKSQMKYTPKVEIRSQKPQLGWLKVAAIFIGLVGISAIIYLTTRQTDTIIQTTIPSNVVAVISTDSTSDQKLPDSTNVFLNKKSRIAYNPDYGSKNREVMLSGEAFFSAKHSKDKPLTVKVENTFIKDIGTEFNIKAYPEQNIIEVYVETGKVEFYSETDEGLTLIKGDVGVYNKKKKSFSRKTSTNANILAYKTKSFTFINARLSDLISQVNNIYSKPLSLKNPELANCLITVSFENEEIETIVSIVAETLDLQYSKTASGFEFDGKVCEK